MGREVTPPAFLFMPSLYIAAPYTKPFFGSYIESLMGSFVPKDLYWGRQWGQPVDVARNLLVDDFMQRGLEHILFTDSDAQWPPEAIKRIMSHDLPVVMGVMYTRKFPPTPTLGYFMGKTKTGRTAWRYSDVMAEIVRECRKQGVVDVEHNSFLLPEPKLLEIDGGGMHFTLIRRDVFEAIRKPYYVMQGTTGAGEDFYFCKKVRDAGIKIHADLSIHTAHSLGEENDVGLREFLQYTKDMDPNKDFRDVPGVLEVG